MPEAMKLIENLETPKNEDELYKQFRYISRIALREGIYPSAFYLLLIDEFSKCEVKEGLRMIADEKIKNSSELEFVVFCIENVAAKAGCGCRACLSRHLLNRVIFCTVTSCRNMKSAACRAGNISLMTSP
ncbi:MAG: hypothetical protein ACLTER_24345 [Ruminococcus sp.]